MNNFYVLQNTSDKKINSYEIDHYTNNTPEYNCFEENLYKMNLKTNFGIQIHMYVHNLPVSFQLLHYEKIISLIQFD